MGRQEVSKCHDRKFKTVRPENEKVYKKLIENKRAKTEVSVCDRTIRSGIYMQETQH